MSKFFHFAYAFSYGMILTSQVVFWSEGFGTGCGTGTLAHGYTTANGTWTVVNTGTNATYANIWYVSAEENGNGAGNCGSACGTNRTLHVSSHPDIAGDVGAAYYSGDGGWFGMPATTDRRVQSPTINCSGRSNITLSFVYIEFGQGTSDNATLWYSADNGATWSQLVDLPKTTCCGGACDGTRQGRWTTYSISLPASANNNPNVRIGFRWVNNNDMLGYDPSFAVDDIMLSVPDPVPIELADFWGYCDGVKVYLYWSTYSELNNQHFEVQYSFDGVVFNVAGIVPGRGNAVNLSMYEFSDEVRGAQVYYRLKQVDVDGHFSLFEPIVIACQNETQTPVAILNLTNQMVSINLPKEIKSNVKIFDMTGKLIYEMEGLEEMEIPLGVNMCFIQVTAGGRTWVIKPKIIWK